MLHLFILLALAFGGLYYAETHGLINPGGIIPDVRGIKLPDIKVGNDEHFDYWKKG